MMTNVQFNVLQQRKNTKILHVMMLTTHSKHIEICASCYTAQFSDKVFIIS